MNRLQAILGYTWAFLALPIIMATFIGNDFWAKELVGISGLKVSPRFTGGEVVLTIRNDNYQTLIHRAVFDGVIGNRSQGFVQINWQPDAGVLPSRIDEEIDFDRDGKKDFRIQLNTTSSKASLTSYQRGVVALEGVYNLGKEKAVRVILKKR